MSRKKNKHRGRRIFAQVFAGTVCGLLFLNTGAGAAFSPIVVPGISSGNDVIQPTKSQLSWIGSICFIFQALGSLSGGQVINFLGRKKGMIVVCLPHVAAWILLWCVKDIATLLIAMALLGLGTAIFKSPILVYMGETCRPSVRGLLVNYSMLFRYIGALLGYFIGALLPWRLAAAAMLTIPGFTVLLLFLIPETPIWLLSRGRKEEALKSLQWLRGWVDEVVVEKEFSELTIYNENNLRCRICDANTSQCPHTNQSAWKRFQAALGDLKERKSVRPLILAMCLFFFSSFSGHVAMKPNYVNIFHTFNMPLDSHWALVGVGIIAVVSNVLCLIVMKKFGKRVVMISSMAISTITISLLGMYADAHLPHNTGTYGRVHRAENQSAIPLVLWITNLLFNSSGVVTIPWIIISEIFPFKSRGTCCGFVGAIHYVFVFIAAKTHINLETAFDISGTFYFYAAVTIVGIIYVYLALPETENRKQEDIEADFASDRIIFANDIFINAVRKCFRFEIPETPIWLLSRGRKEQALKSLQWLRGWVDETTVEKEFCELTIYNENNLKCKICEANTSQCPHANQSAWKKFQAALVDLKDRKTVRPLILALGLFFFSSFSGHMAMKPNIVNIFHTFNMPIDSHWALVGMAIIAVTSNILCIIVMKKIGKRVVMLSSMVIVTITVCLLGIYADAHLPHNTGTYGQVHRAENQSTIPLVLWITNLFFNSSGVVTIPWIIMSEIFPFKSRGTCCGFVGAMHYVFVFIAAKTHINLETALDISGTFYFYAAVTIVGIVYAYLALPETENRKQEDIEADFASDRIIFANDICINAIRRCFGFEVSKKIETTLP